MSKFGDKLFGRLARIAAGLESSSRPGLRCSRCEKDLSDTLVLFEKEQYLCDDCEDATRKEHYISCWKGANPPTYDIDVILFESESKPWEIVQTLNSKIDPWCPEALLLPPELVVRDFGEFQGLEGHDFGYLMGYDGCRTFMFGLRALQAIGATHLAECMCRARDYALSKGVKIPSPLPDPWIDEVPIGDELVEELDDMTNELKPYEGIVGGDTSRMLLKYLQEHVDLLRQRKPRDSKT